MQDKFKAALAALQQDKQPLRLEMSKFDAWILMSTLQLACRHPQFNGPTRKIAEEIARQIQGAVADSDSLKMLAEMGWHQQFDEPK